MAFEWKDAFENEEELKKLTGVQLRELYRNAPEDKKGIIAKVASENLVDLDTDVFKSTVFDILAEVNVVTEHNDNQEEKLAIDYDKIYTRFNEYIADYQTGEEKNQLVESFTIKSLTEILKVSAAKLGEDIKNSDNYRTIEGVNRALKDKIEADLSNQTEYSPVVEEHYYLAEHAGALDDVSQEAKDKFIKFVAQNTGWRDASKEKIINADKVLSDNVPSLDIYIDQNGQKVLNPIYKECNELASSIKYEFPENTDEETQQKLTLAYNQQLMANALQRATHDVLKNPSLLGKGESKEEIEESFKNLIADNFSRSVVVAGLATSPNTTDGITIDKNTGRVDYNKSDVLASEIEEILKGQRKISPLAVSLDTHQLVIETSRCEKVLKTVKNVDTEKLPFYKKVLAVGKAAWNNVVKQGGWKKIAVNGFMFGGAAVAMASGASAVVAAGSIVYAGWTAANAWAAPVWDKLSAEMREKKITGFKNKWAYRISNWKRAREQKYAEPGFKERAAWRTVEGVGMAAVSGALGLSGATPWVKTLTRQGAMVVGKSSSLTRSWFKKKTAAEKLAEQYSVANYQALQTAEGYLKQDKVALAAVVGFSAIADVAKATDLADSLGEQLSDITEKVKSGQTPEVTPVANDGETPVVNDGETPVVNDGETPVANDVETPVANDGETPVANDGETPVANDGETPTGEVRENPIKIEDLDNDHKKMFLNSHKKWENADINKYIEKLEEQGYHVSGDFKGTQDGIVNKFYEAIQKGKVESCPEGMTPVEYVDKLTRLAQLAPGAQKNATELMIRDLLCPKFVPTDTEKEVVAQALNTISYDKGSSQFIMIDDNGNTCVKKMPNFGNYFGPQKVAEIEIDGQKVILPIRNENVTVALGAEVSCDQGTGRIASVYVVNKVDCGCGPAPVAEPEPEPEPVIPVKEDANGENIGFEAEKDVVLPKEKVDVDMQDPTAVATAVKSGQNSYYNVDVSTVNGSAKSFQDGTLQVWDKDGNIVTEEGFENINATGAKGLQISVQAPLDVRDVVAKLPDAPTNVITGADGSITYEYKFESGKNIQVVLDAIKEDSSDRVGHFIINDKEVIIDNASTDALMEKMTQNTNMEFSSVDGAEQSVSDRIEIKERLQRRMDEYYGNQAENMENPISTSEETASLFERRTEAQSVSLTSEQKGLIMDDKTELTCIGVKDGKAILEVKGVEGVSRIAVAAPTQVDFDLISKAPQATVGENGSYSVAIATTDEKELLVSIAEGKVKTTLDGKPVVLDSQSSEATQLVVRKALLEKNVNMNIDLHTSFTEKVIKAVEKASSVTENAKATQVVSATVGNSAGR